MADSLKYKLSNGKPIKALFFIKGYLKACVPHFYYSLQRSSLLRQFNRREDRDYILERVNYYNKLIETVTLPPENHQERLKTCFFFLDKIKNFRPSTFHKAYFFDLKDSVRWFSKQHRICYIPGDVYFTPEVPALVKSRLLENNTNSVVLKLDKLRHFMFVNDPIPFSQKKNQAIFRGKIRFSRIRHRFMELYHGSGICDCGVIGKNEGFPENWITPKKTIREHFDYKFIMALEGNDVASNLKWVMSSNSIAVMTRPTCETWFMEGKLIPDYHYIQINDDMSDLEEKLTYYINHPDKAEEIIAHAHEYVAQFFDKKREKIISLLVAEKYFKMTNQKI